MIKIYLDMDSVICDFMKHYHMIEPKVDTPKKFHTMVMEHQIFEKLDWMPNGEKLIALLNQLGHPVEILSSLGTHTELIASHARRQKEFWLLSHEIHYKQNFVNTWAHKYRYASKYSLIIDDRGDVCEDFIRAGGKAVVYIDHKFDEMEAEIRKVVNEMTNEWRLEQQTQDLNSSLIKT